MLVKNSSMKGFALRIFVKLVLDGIAGVKFLLEGSPLHTWSVIKAHFYVYRHLGSVLKQRRKLKKQFGFKNLDTIYPKSIVASHYLLGKKTFKELDF